jgi:prophage DNA circulation protein
MSRPGWVLEGVVSGLQGVVAQLEAIYAANQIDSATAAAFTLAVATGPSISPTTPAPTSTVTGLYAAFVALYDILPALVSDVTGIDPSVGPGLIALAEGLAAAMTPSSASSAFALAADLAADAAAAAIGATDNRQAFAANAELIQRFTRFVFLSGYIEGLVTQSYATRAAAITARADCVQRFQRELELCGLSSDIGVANALTQMRDTAVAYLSQAIVNAQPVLTVTTPVQLPALFLAYRLYQDPTRASELIARNGVSCAELMPLTFEALAA